MGAERTVGPSAPARCPAWSSWRGDSGAELVERTRWRTCCTNRAEYRGGDPAGGWKPGRDPRAPRHRRRRICARWSHAAIADAAGTCRPPGWHSWRTSPASPGLEDSPRCMWSATGYVGLNRVAVDGEGRTVANVALVIPAREPTGGGRIAGFFFEELERFPGVGSRPATGCRGEILITGRLRRGSSASGDRMVALLVGERRSSSTRSPARGSVPRCRGRNRRRGGDSRAGKWRTGPPRSGSPPTVSPPARRHSPAEAVERLVGYGMYFPALSTGPSSGWNGADSRTPSSA